MELRPACKAWLGIAAGVVAYEIACPNGETLSEGVDRALERPIARYVALGGIAVTAAHLSNFIPQQYDPFHYALMWKTTPE